MSMVLDAVSGHASEYRNAIALSDDRDALTYEALWRETEEWAATLDGLLEPTETIGSCLENSVLWVLLDLALIKLRSPTVPVPLFFTEAQRRHALAHSGATVLLADRPMVGHDSPRVLQIFGRTLYLHRHDAAPVELPTGTAKVTYTSGTTGNSKGVCLSQSALESVANGLVEVIGQEYAGIHCALLPLPVLLENVAGLYTTLLAGGRYHVPRLGTVGFGKGFAPDFGLLAGALETCGATSTILVPELLRGLAATLQHERASLPAMKILAVGGARISQSLLEQAEALHLPVFQGYGLSESASVVAVNTPDHNRLGAVGKILPGVGLELSADGEILLNRPAYLGYIGEGPAPPRFATGDIGHFDDAGYLYIDGRKSNVLITAFGRNVAPEWVESELLSHPSIAQAMVFGDAMPALGALVVPSSVSVTDDEIARAMDHANQRLPEYAQVRHWTKVPPFTPASHQLTGNGRLRRAIIERDYQQLTSACLSQPGLYISFFEKLIGATNAGRAAFLATPQIRDGLAGRISRSTYLYYLAEAYHHVKHTVSLMRLTDERLLPRQTWLREALGRYISEETGHEEWILEDIAHAGGDAEAVRHGTPRFATELMVSYAYDYVGRVNPIGFLGMVFVLESTSERLASRGAQALMQSLGLPENCFRYLVSHGSVDVDHMRFFQNLMFLIDDPQDQAAVIHMATAMYRLYGDLFASIPHVEDSARVA
jgi:long-chain acyl-CoA synthetase